MAKLNSSSQDGIKEFWGNNPARLYDVVVPGVNGKHSIVARYDNLQEAKVHFSNMESRGEIVGIDKHGRTLAGKYKLMQQWKFK